MVVNDGSFIWKQIAQERIAERSLFIPFDMGMEFLGNVTCGDLVRIIRESTGGQPLTGELRNFLYADLIVAANDVGQTKYLTVEIAFYATEIHSRTAIRHAEILEEHSGVPTIPVVASYQISSEVQEAVDSGRVYWHYVPDHVLDPH